MSEGYFQLVYVSAAAATFDESELPALLATARRNNSAREITGMLLYHQRSFIQVLTGNQTDVESLFEKIAKDPRHTDTRILLRRNVSERSFNDWSMGFYHSSAVNNRNLPGLNDVLDKGFDSEAEDDEQDIERLRVIQVLEGFRDGQWRQAVSTV